MIDAEPKYDNSYYSGFRNGMVSNMRRHISLYNSNRLENITKEDFLFFLINNIFVLQLIKSVFLNATLYTCEK